MLVSYITLTSWVGVYSSELVGVSVCTYFLLVEFQSGIFFFYMWLRVLSGFYCILFKSLITLTLHQISDTVMTTSKSWLLDIKIPVFPPTWLVICS